MKQLKVILTRNGDLIPFDISRIERAIEKAAESSNYNDISFIDELSETITQRLTDMLLESSGERTITIEDIQDEVENVLMDSEYKDIAKHYILYRAERANSRKKAREATEKKIEKNTLKIIKSDGKRQTFDREKIRETYKRVSFKLARQCKFEELEESLKKYIVDGMKTADITNMMIKSAIDLISVENIDCSISQDVLRHLISTKRLQKIEISLLRIFIRQNHIFLFPTVYQRRALL